LFYYWFAIADRYAIFLYGHHGAMPFDKRTSSRYWMSGLVACGTVMVLYAMANWFFGRLAGIRFRSYTPPAWWQVWLVSAPLLAIGIPSITLVFNQPTLRPSDATACVAVTLAGLALALTPGRLAAQRPLELVWLAITGLGLVPSLLLLRALELPAAGLATGRSAYLLSSGSLVVGIIWLTITSWLGDRRQLLHLAAHRFAPTLFDRPEPMADAAKGASRPLVESVKLLVSAFCQSYLLLPLAHHLYLTPSEHRYISTSANFFALNLSTQLFCFLVTAALALGVTFLRQRRGDERYSRRGRAR
jgi:hypothetical protein